LCACPGCLPAYFTRLIIEPWLAPLPGTPCPTPTSYTSRRRSSYSASRFAWSRRPRPSAKHGRATGGAKNSSASQPRVRNRTPRPKKRGGNVFSSARPLRTRWIRGPGYLSPCPPLRDGMRPPLPRACRRLPGGSARVRGAPAPTPPVRGRSRRPHRCAIAPAASRRPPSSHRRARRCSQGGQICRRSRPGRFRHAVASTRPHERLYAAPAAWFYALLG
jgi:hypothetical protein